MQINFKVNTKRTTEVLQRVPSRLEVHLHGALEAMARLHIRNMALRMRGTRSMFSNQTKNLTGTLQRSFTYATRRTPGVLANLSTRVFSAGNKYATLQQYGGVVRAKRGKYLAIPQAAVKTPAGVPRYASPRNYPGKTFVMRDRLGRLWIVESKRKGGKRAAGFQGPMRQDKEQLTFLWQLVKSVTIRGKLNWFEQWRRDAPMRRSLLSAAVKRALGEAAAK